MTDVSDQSEYFTGFCKNTNELRTIIIYISTKHRMWSTVIECKNEILSQKLIPTHNPCTCDMKYYETICSVFKIRF